MTQAAGRLAADLIAATCAAQDWPCPQFGLSPAIDANLLRRTDRLR